MNARLPALPDRRAPVRLSDLERIEQRVATQLPKVRDIDELREWQSQAAALAAYLDDKLLRGPMLGAQRRVEARIGELLGPASATTGRPLLHDVKLVSPNDRRDFRVLAAGLNGQVKLGVDEWRTSRRALVSLIREQLPSPPRSSIASADVQARKELRHEFRQRMRRLASDALWLQGRVGRTVAVAPASEIDAWLVRLDDTLARLALVRDALTKGEA